MNAKIAVDERLPWHTERCWAIHKGGAQYLCALIHHGTPEVQVQVFQAGRSFSVDRCESRAAAIAKADALKAEYLLDGGLIIT